MARIRVQTACLLLAAGIGAGCFSHASNTPLGRSDVRGPPTAILPVRLGDVVVKVPGVQETNSQIVHESLAKDYRDLVDSTNSVLDHLARGTGVLGPSEVEDRCAHDPVLQQLTVYLEDPGPVDESWKSAGLSRAAARLRVKRFILVRPVVEFELPINTSRNDRFTPTVSTKWPGHAGITVTLFDLDPPRVTSTATALSSFYSEVGVLILVSSGPYPAALPVPYGFGVGVDQAIEESARRALRLALSPTP